MNRSGAVLAVSLASAFAVPLVAPEALARRGGIVECGDLDVGVGIHNLTTRGVSCSRARRIARAYSRDKTPSGFRCRERNPRQFEFDIRCTRGSQVVRWQFITD
jgi:hypothetical protein